jgi:Nif-specific regulatory protein
LKSCHRSLYKQAMSSVNSRIEALFSAATILGTLTRPQEVVERILEVASRMVGADRALLFSLNHASGELELASGIGLAEGEIQEALDISRGALTRARAGKPIVALDAQADEALRQNRSVARFGIRSILCAPLTLLGETLGVLYVDSRRADHLFGADDVEYLDLFAQQAALAIDLSRRADTLRQDTHRLRLELEGRTERFGIIGRSASIQRLWETIERVAPYPMPVFIHGESGTGKELVARALHAHSGRRAAAFVGHNCAAVPETLLESELFGHVRGAFTGADRDQRGLFEQAHGGTLFLDEVAEMSPGVQAKLLRTLQEGEIRPLGSDQRRNVDVRVIAATHRDPAESLDSGSLRQDLFYRRAPVRIDLPPLRDRREDIPLLFTTFIERAARRQQIEPPKIDPRIWRQLAAYDWPGNVRELLNEAERLCLLCGRQGVLGPAELERQGCAALSPLPAIDEGEARVEPLGHLEKAAIQRALRACGGNRDEAARRLGISRATLFRKLKRLDLKG